MFGGGDYAMRIWLDPDKVASRGLTAGDVVRAVREQNIQVSAGQLGAEPMPNGSDFLTSINAQGRLRRPTEFGDIVLKTGDDGEIVRLSDVARIELGASDYTLRCAARQQGRGRHRHLPGARRERAGDPQRGDRARWTSWRRASRRASTYRSVYDTTVFVRDSIKAVVTTLLEAVLLVVLVVILFLQTWRASIIPLIAVPVSIVGTFAALYLLGFSINTLTLFGLVLAIGIVVDDAIVVVENVERNIEEGAAPLAGGAPGDAGSVRADRRDRTRAVRGVRADGVPDRRHRAVLQAVRRDDRDLDGDLGDQLADAVARAGREAATSARRTEGCRFRAGSSVCSAGCSARSTVSSRQAPTRYQGAVSRTLGRRGARVRRLCRAAARHRLDVPSACRAASSRRRTSCT